MKYRMGVAVNARREFIVTVPDGFKLPEGEIEDEDNPKSVADAILWEYRMWQIGQGTFDVEGLVEEVWVYDEEWIDSGVIRGEAE